MENTVDATFGSCAKEADNPELNDWESVCVSTCSCKLSCAGESRSSNGLYTVDLPSLRSGWAFKLTSLKFSVFCGNVARLSVLKIASTGSSAMIQKNHNI